MGRCEVCHNDEGQTFEVLTGQSRHTFDTFECAINALAPVCAICQSRIVGHPVEEDGHLYCGAHCCLLKRASVLARLID